MRIYTVKSIILVGLALSSSPYLSGTNIPELLKKAQQADLAAQNILKLKGYDGDKVDPFAPYRDQLKKNEATIEELVNKIKNIAQSRTNIIRHEEALSSLVDGIEDADTVKNHIEAIEKKIKETKSGDTIQLLVLNQAKTMLQLKNALMQLLGANQSLIDHAILLQQATKNEYDSKVQAEATAKKETEESRKKIENLIKNSKK